MNREVHVRFWESPEVKVLRATRHLQRIDGAAAVSGSDPIATRSSSGSWNPCDLLTYASQTLSGAYRVR